GQHALADRTAPGPGSGHGGSGHGGSSHGGSGCRRCGVTARLRGVALTPMETRRDVIVRAAVLADELGFASFSVPEGWGLDSAPVLTEIALRTTGIKLVSAIVSV